MFILHVALENHSKLNNRIRIRNEFNIFSFFISAPSLFRHLSLSNGKESPEQKNFFSSFVVYLKTEGHLMHDHVCTYNWKLLAYWIDLRAAGLIIMCPVDIKTEPNNLLFFHPFVDRRPRIEDWGLFKLDLSNENTIRNDIYRLTTHIKRTFCNKVENADCFSHCDTQIDQTA